MNDDLISRRAAIEAIKRAIWDKYTAKDAIDAVCNVPSAQPEIVRCKDCKYWHREIHDGIEYFNFSTCDLNHYGDGHNFFCADAERGTDG